MNIQPLSDADLWKVLGYDTKIFTVDDLPSTAENLFFAKPYCVFLYEWQKDNGHWIGIIKLGNGDIEYFDPTGGIPDSNIGYFNYTRSVGKKKLLNLLSEYHFRTGAAIHYNPVELQSIARNYATCGYHVLARLLNYDTPIDSYTKKVKKLFLDPDIGIYNYIFEILKNSR